ncbi:MAG: phosphatase PAP2 family protein [Acidimicrobiia bacterium]
MTTPNGDSTEQRRLTERPLLTDHPAARRLAIALWVLGVLLFLALAIPITADWVQVVDDWVHALAIDLENGFAVGLAEAMNLVGSTWVVTPVMVLTAAFLLWKRRWEALAYWVLAMVGSQLLIGPIKSLYARPRPPMALVETTGYSFPSGHAVAGAAVAVALVIVLVPAGPKRRNLEILAAAFAVLMALSRVYLRAHWLSDTVSGAALGAGVAIGAAALVHFVEQRRASA